MVSFRGGLYLAAVYLLDLYISGRSVSAHGTQEATQSVAGICMWYDNISGDSDWYAPKSGGIRSIDPHRYLYPADDSAGAVPDKMSACNWHDSHHGAFYTYQKCKYGIFGIWTVAAV